MTRPPQSISSTAAPGMTAVAPTPPAEASAAVDDVCAAAMSRRSSRVPTAAIVSPSTRIASGGVAEGSSSGANERTTAWENRRIRPV